jgi:PD-(D/E)XK nuclease superfamily
MASFSSNLIRLNRQPSLELELLDRHWSKVRSRVDRERRKLSQPIKDDDPIKFSTDLLTPIVRTLDENTHTRSIAFLFDKSQPHGFETKVLRQFINLCPNKKTKKILKLLSLENNISVEPEFRFRTERNPERSLGRCDIRIRIETDKGNAIVIVENKISAAEGDSQLRWYERHAHSWCKDHVPAERLFVYLTPRGIKASSPEWVNLSYLELASVLRHVWFHNRRAPGSSWLGLYTAAVVRGVLGIDSSSVTPEQIKTYLGASING